jgi:hypothetical protein
MRRSFQGNLGGEPVCAAGFVPWQTVSQPSVRGRASNRLSDQLKRTPPAIRRPYAQNLKESPP